MYVRTLCETRNCYGYFCIYLEKSRGNATRISFCDENRIGVICICVCSGLSSRLSEDVIDEKNEFLFCSDNILKTSSATFKKK